MEISIAIILAIALGIWLFTRSKPVPKSPKINITSGGGKSRNSDTKEK